MATLAHYFHMAVRAINSDRFFSITNIIGLAIGLASASLIFIYVASEFDHDRWIPGHEEIFRVDTTESAPGRDPVGIARAPGPVSAALLKDFPQIRETARAYQIRASVFRDGQPLDQDVLAADPNFLSLFSIPMVKGDAGKVLNGTASVAISEKKSIELFGSTDALGKSIVIAAPDNSDFIVSGVFKDIPANSHLKFDILISAEGYFNRNQSEIGNIRDQWGGAYFYTYAILKKGGKISEISAEIPKFIDRNIPPAIASLITTKPHEYFNYEFIPVRDTYFETDHAAAMKPPGSKSLLFALTAVGVIILLIAAINFANLMGARSTLRVKEVALRKILGASRTNIIAQFLVEAGVVTLISSAISMIIIIVILPFTARIFGDNVGTALLADWTLWVSLIFLTFSTAVLSGLYPAVAISRTRPGLALNRDFSQKAAGWIRNLLVILQFSVSIALVTMTLVMSLQYRHTRQAELGFDKSDMVVVNVPAGKDQATVARSLKQAITRNANIIGVALSSAVPSDPSEDNISVDHPESAKPLQLGYHVVDSDFFETYRIKAISGSTKGSQGSDQAPSDESAPVPVDNNDRQAILNMSAVTKLGYRTADEVVGKQLRSDKTSYTILGVVPDVHFRSFREKIRDELYILKADAGARLSVRYRPGAMAEAVAQIDDSWRTQIPNRSVDREFLDTKIAALYERENTQIALLGFFATIAIILSCLGLLAMSAYAVQRRNREIAIRKVLGAGSLDVLKLLMWQFCKPVVIANLLAWPFAWYFLRNWLNQFAYRIDLPLFAFAVATLFALVIAASTVAANTIKVSRMNPINALRQQ
jgi:putative ABC transport system permease protein